MLPPQADALVGFASIQATLWSRPDRPVASRRAAPKRCSRPRRQQLVLLDSTVSATSSARSPRSVAIPVVMCDVLDTLVADPFTRGMAEHLGFDDFKEFLDAKTPDIWPDFELGRVSEDQLSRHFFKDKSRRLDVPAMKRFLLKAYAFNPGVEDMLRFLRESGVELHAFSNYPIWFTLIEQSLKLEREHGVRWTFVSACEGLRKPSLTAFERAAANANVSVSDCLLIDDRQVNCDAARAAGFAHAIRFESAGKAVDELRTFFEPYVTTMSE
jgi:FMN hydrolase / 5-amino-6-(5-phospho-D-ribitylamino)uracil phosphatase